MSVATAEADVSKSKGRSRMSNGRALLPGVDGRSTWARRLRDLIALHLGDVGGEGNASEAEKSILRRAATLTVELERLELKFAEDGQASPADLDLYQRVSNTLRRHLEAVGLERRAIDITGRIEAYVAGKRAGQ